MSKKFLAVLLTVILCALSFSACGSNISGIPDKPDTEKKDSPMMPSTSFEENTQSPDTVAEPQTSDVLDTTKAPDTTKFPDTTKAPDTTKPSTPPVTPTDVKARISFVAAGDNIVHEAVFTDAMNRAAVLAFSGSYKKEYEFASMYTDISSIISRADIAFVNQEAPLGGKALGISGYPLFNSPDDCGDDLISLGFDVINVANNHMLDKDEVGLANTIKFFESRSALMIGGYTKSDFDNIRMLTSNGIKIAFLSYTSVMNYDANGNMRAVPASSNLLIPYATDANLSRQIPLAKASGADLVFVSMHWGVEDSFTPNAEQKRIAKLAADLGADVIIGHHSHTLQPIEWITGKNGNRTLVAYSLGNIISTMHPNRNMVGGILGFDIVRDDKNNVYIENPILTPTVCHYSMTRDALQIYQMKNYTESMANQHGSQLQGAFTLNTLKKYVTDTIAKEFLPDWIK